MNALVSTGAFTYDEVMNRIPWRAILMMIGDRGRKRERDENDNLMTEEEELSFFGLK